jgi:tRNA 2-thiocytidine biosynthesis protein TtcA
MSRARSACHRRLARAVGRAVAEYDLIEDGDRILCAVSGGKDSFVLHELLMDLSRRAPVRFHVIAVHVDQGLPAGDPGGIQRAFVQRGVPCRVVADDTFSIVQDKLRAGQTPCVLCSRLRRAILYRVADELGCTRIALGHHRDDVLVTLLLNLLFVGQLKAMPPRLVSDDGAHVLIRPLAYCAEQDIAAFAAERGWSSPSAGCCGAGQAERARLAAWLGELEQRHPGVRQTMLAALRDVRPSHLLDVGLWRALGLPVAAAPSGGSPPRLGKGQGGQHAP